MNVQRRTVYILLISALFITGINTVLVNRKVLLGGDEIISYLCATGNQGNYGKVLQHQPPYGEITSASDWQALLTITEPHCFEKIATDLSRSDLHPPLYFWLLHLFVLNFGVSVFTGVLLNTLLQLLCIFPLFLLARKIFRDEGIASLAVLIWSISPAVTIIGYNARPYELLTLIHILFALNFIYWLEKPTRITAVLIAVLATAGFMTHYSFIYAAAGYFIYAVFRYRQTGIRNLLALSAAFFVAGMTLTMLHPHYADSFALQQERAQHFTAGELPARIGKAALSYLQFFVPVLSLKSAFMMMPKAVTLISLIIALSAGGLLVFIFRKRLTPFCKSLIQQAGRLPFLWFMLTWVTLVNVLPYLLFITPFHAMGGQYLTALYPYYAMAVALALISIQKKWLRITVITGIALGSVTVLAAESFNQTYGYSHLIAMVQKDPLIVINSVDRRGFPRLIPHLRNEQKILMLEEAEYRNDSIMRLLMRDHQPFLMITTQDKRAECTKSYSRECHSFFDMRDGVKWSLKEFNGKAYDDAPLP